MTLGKLAWITGGFVFFCVAAMLFVFSLALFTDVFATTYEQVMYDCTACLKKDPTRCKTIKQTWSMSELKTEDEVREYVAFRLCDEVVPREEDRVKYTCGDWVLKRRDQIFDFRCTSHLEREKRKPIGMRVH